MPPEIVRYLNIHHAYAPSFSSDGRRVAFISTITGLPQVWSVGFDLTPGAPIQWPTQITFGQERVLGAWYSPAPGDGRLVYAMDAGGNENSQLFLLATDGSSDRCLTPGRPDVMHLFQAWHPAGQQIALAANRRHPGLFDLHALDLATGEIRLVWRSDQPGYIFGGTYSPDGTHLAFALVRSNADSDIYQVDLASGHSERLNQTPGFYAQPLYSNDGRQVYARSNAGRDKPALVRFDLASGAWDTLFAPEQEIDQIAISDSGQQLALSINDGGASRLLLLDPDTGSVIPAPDLPEGVASFFGDTLCFSVDGQRLAFSFSHATRTTDVYVWDMAVVATRPITSSSHAGLSLDGFVAPDLVHYPSFDGLQIPAWYYKPSAGRNPLAVVILVHGGPESQARPFFNPVVQYLLACGYAVLAPNVRGSSGYGKAYMDMDNVRRRLDSVADLAHAAYWLREQVDVNPQRIAVMGASYGGFMVLAGLTHYPNLWAAGVSIVGISNLVSFLENTSDYRRAHREAEYGSLEHDRAFLAEISPLSHLDQIQAPLLVIHGANDPRVPVGESEQIVAHLQERGVPVESLIFPDEGHGIVKLSNKLIAYPRVAEFLAHHLEERK